MNALSALLFVAAASLRNLLRRQLQRMRQPKYLVATCAGALYLWGIFARHRARPSALVEQHFEHAMYSAVLLGLALLFVLWTWLFGGDEGALQFSEAEIQFLFPAPLSRHALVHYKLVRSLLLAMITALFLTFGLGARAGAPTLQFFVGAWFGVSTVALHSIAASLTRASLLQHGISGPLRRATAFVVPALMLGAIGFALWQAPPLPEHFYEFSPWYRGLLETGVLRAATFIFRPALDVALGHAAVERGWLVALFAAAGVLALHYLWALSTDADFNQASIASAEKRSKVLALRRAGHLPLRAAKAPFRLAATGHPAFAIYWKNLTAAVRLLSLRLAVGLGLSSMAIVLPVLFIGAYPRRLMAAIACLLLAGYFTVFGTQIYRIDFRLDLNNMDLLRTFPLRGREIAAAEIAAPWTVLTGAQWVCILAAAVLAPANLLGPHGRTAAAIALAIALPAVNLCMVVVQNAGALLFPAWISAGTQGPRGIEAMGQRLLTLFGTVVAVAVALVPAAIAGGLALAVLFAPMGNLAAIPAALVGAGVVAVEAAFAVVGLGRAFERFDLAER